MATNPMTILMDEFQESEILWPAPASGGSDGGAAAPNMPCSSVRPKAAEPRPATAPVEISRRKRRCRPWPASEFYTNTFDQETDIGGEDEEEEGRDVKGTTTTTTSEDGSVMVPPHVLVARRRLVMVGGGRTAAYSMCAGRGRTLKGRDLRDVRNLVLKMTGFIEE